MTLDAKAARLRLLLFDVDGVLTDGTIELYADGTESKRFDIRDGTGFVWARRAGLLTGILSGRSAAATAIRAGQLGMTVVIQGVLDKLSAYEGVLRDYDLTDAEVGFMGDDLLDLPVLGRAGVAAAPADAADEVRTRVDWVSRAGGGHGAAREFIELVLRAQGRWDPLLRDYTGGRR